MDWLTIGKVLLLTFLAGLSGCEDKYKTGHDAGYAEGYAAGYAKASEEAEQRAKKLRQEAWRAAFSEPSSPVVAASICGGNGMNLNGKYIRPGKTGCVDALSDGTFRRY